MHDAYEALPILEKMPLQIEAMACYGDILLVGTRQGHLLVYTVRPMLGRTDARFDVTLDRFNKAFAKKPITQLAVVPEYHILISLSDGIVNVHDLTVFALITSIPRCRGATLFAIDVQRAESINGDIQYTLRMCVSVRKKIQLYFWKNRDFHELQPDLGIPDVPKSMEWCKNSLCVGFKRDYFLITVDGANSGHLKELFPTGKYLEPTVTRLVDDRLALGRDEMTIFLDSEGNPTQKCALTWSEPPVVMVHHPPYIIAVLPKHIEIRTIEPRLLIQSIELLKPRLISNHSGHVYIASANYVWRLSPTPITLQIKQLLTNKEFELALHLANMTEEVDVDKGRRLQSIRNLYAFELFSQHQFEASLKIFAELGTDPSHVIGLFPNLLPQDFRKDLAYPDTLPDLEGAELEKGLLSLVEYLLQKRNQLVKDIGQNKELVSSAIVEGNVTIKSKRQLSQIIDTTLLKCYIQTNDALVAPLLRLKDNNCHIDESERVLKKSAKYSELIILYEKKGLHRKALDLLARQAQKPNSPLKGHDTTVQYLQRLGAEHFNLIKDYAEWVLRDYPEDGLKIFTEDLPEVEALPREDVWEYLERTAKTLVIPYLEHVIHTWMDETPAFHNALAIQYKDLIQELWENSQDPDAPPRLSPDKGELADIRTKLMEFLQTSEHYVPERLLAHFPFSGFFEERAILLGKLGRHEQALSIYVHILKDNNMAQQYCTRNYDVDKEGNKDVFLYLLKMYLSPPDPKSLGIMAMYNTISVERDTEAAVRLLEEHSGQIDTARALELLPADTHVSDLVVFMENVLENVYTKKRDSQVLKSLLYAEHLQVQEQRMFYQKIKCTVTEEKVCRVCKKRLGNAAFARYPNGVIVHYYCCKDPSVCPDD